MSYWMNTRPEDYEPEGWFEYPEPEPKWDDSRQRDIEMMREDDE